MDFIAHNVTFHSQKAQPRAMFKRARLLLSLPLCALAAAPLAGQAEEDDEEVSILRSERRPPAEVDRAPETPDRTRQNEANGELTIGTKLYDADSVEDLFRSYQAENQKRAEEMAPHLNADGLDVIELAPVQVDPYHIRNLDLLAERLDPRPRQRLARLAELDPEAAAELRTTMRAEERFFAGEHDATFDANAGRAAEVDFRRIGASVSQALDRAKQAVRSKKMTDDQESLPVEEQ